MLIKNALVYLNEEWVGRGHVCACVMKHKHVCESMYMSVYLYDLISMGAGICFCILYVFKYLHVDWCVFCVFLHLYLCVVHMVKNLPAMQETGSITGLGRSPGGGNGNQLQYFCLENSMDRGAWWATVHGMTKVWTGLSN